MPASVILVSLLALASGPELVQEVEHCVIVTVTAANGQRVEKERCTRVPSGGGALPPGQATGSPGQGGSGTSGCIDTPGPNLDGDFSSDDATFFRVNSGVRQMLWIHRCPGEAGTPFWRDIDGDPAATEEPVFTAADLVPNVFDAVRRQLPEPIPVIAPADRNDAGFAYVQYHTYFWVEQRAGQWATVTATSSVPGLSLTVTAEPVAMIVETGDGGRVECPGAPPALPPNSSPVGFRGCGYVYRDSSAMAPNGETFPVTVTVEWHATWTASNGESGDLGALSTTSSPRDLAVAEIQAVLTG